MTTHVSIQLLTSNFTNLCKNVIRSQFIRIAFLSRVVETIFL